MSHNVSKHLLGAVACVLMSALAATAQDAPPPKPVGVITLTQQSVPRIYTLPGRAAAYEQAGIRPRVTGIVQEVLYRPGAKIDAGGPMFRIDPVVYEAAVSQAEADVASARAGVTQKSNAFDRASQLVGSGVSQADLEQTQAELEQARASLQAAEAQLSVARTELAWTTVTSPISGMSSVPLVTVGALVSANQAEDLATVIRLDPIEVDMYEPSGTIQTIRDDLDTGRLRLSDNLRATLTLENGSIYAADGELVAPSYSVSSTTGTVGVRFRFDNPEGRIYPGMFVRGQIELGSTDAFLVPQSAATRGRDGRLTAWIAEGDVAAQRPLVEDGVHNNHWVVIEGLAEGDQLIVDGFAGLTAGAPLSAVPVTIDAEGVVRTPDASGGE